MPMYAVIADAVLLENDSITAVFAGAANIKPSDT